MLYKNKYNFVFLQYDTSDVNLYNSIMSLFKSLPFHIIDYVPISKENVEKISKDIPLDTTTFTHDKPKKEIVNDGEHKCEKDRIV